MTTRASEIRDQYIKELQDELKDLEPRVKEIKDSLRELGVRKTRAKRSDPTRTEAFETAVAAE